ncbi:MAG: tetratricopeptide repeat protein [Gammaproteobacteria bacterium]|nr:tetratricopeptide repeat protein [Gammaproteobacteria bacterium]
MSDLHRIAELITRRHGLMSQERWQEILPRALSELIDSDPERLTREDLPGALIDDIAGRLTVGETFFLRHQSQFTFILEHIRALLHERPFASVRVLSAGCSTGEEPYSLAITLAGGLSLQQSERVRITACDLNVEAICRARDAVYGAWSFRGVPDWLRDGFFEPAEAGGFRLNDDVRRRVHFEHGSILDVLAQTPGGSIDVVLFRNVGIYLSEAHLAQVYSRMKQALSSRGILVVAPSDPRPPASEFDRLPHESTAIYTATQAPVTRPRLPLLVDTKSPASRPRKQLDATAMSVASVPSGTLPVLETSDTDPGILQQQMILRLADQGRLGEAVTLADRLIGEQPTSSAAYMLRGQIHLAGDQPSDLEAAQADFRRAVFLSPKDPMARYWYAQALISTGNGRKAVLQLDTMTDLLDDPVSRPHLQAHQMDREELLQAALFMKEGLQ